MKAMIFAAGKGIRLKPLTNNTPKALVKVNGIPLLGIIIKKLILFGVNEIIVNVHYLAEQIIDYLEVNKHFGIRIEISDESKQLLDTGGGLKKASWFFNDGKPFIVHNTDVISDIDIANMLSYHNKNKAIATLAVRNRKTNRYFLFNETNELCGWKNLNTNEQIITKNAEVTKDLAFSGIQILNPNIFKYLQDENKFSIVDTYLMLSKSHKTLGYVHDNGFWFDIGNLEKLSEAERYLYS